MSNFSDAFDAGKGLQWPRPTLPTDLADKAVVLTDSHGNERVELLPVEALTNTLPEKRGTVNFLDVDSFARYVLDQKGDGTRVFVNPTTQTVVAVLDGHGKAAQWGRHRAVLVTKRTRVWDEWTKFCETFHTQVPFAEFIESHITEIAMPDGATLLDMVTTLEVKTDVQFASATKLANGQTQLTYHETIAGSTQKGTAQIPENLTLAMPPIEGITPDEDGVRNYVVQAKLRYRVGAGELKLRVELHRPLDVLEEAFKDRIADLTEKVGAALIFQGDAPAEVQPVIRK